MALWQGSSMNATEYKHYHESYMANNEGTTSMDVFFRILFTVQCTVYSAFRGRQMKAQIVVFEYLTIVFPLTLAHTVFSHHIYLLNCIIFVFILYELRYFYPRFTNPSIIMILQQKNAFRRKHIESISCLRSLTYLITVYAILAVDFRAFRKELCKTEQYGYSLMDTGVGLFTLMSGIVHKDLRNHSLKQIFMSNMKFILVLVSLGTARFWTVKALDYHEHVTEYGVHWNFFFTVAMCKFTSTVLLYVTNRPFLFSAISLIMHECVLYYGLETWVFSEAPRTSLLSANREGISSCLGYTALYLFAAHVKRVVSDRTQERYKILMKLIVGSVFFWLLLCCINVFRPISRTLANSAYCMYLSAICLTILSILYFIEVTHQDDKGYFRTPTLLFVINQNGLIYFLVANLLTGAVNLSIQTLFVSNSYAIVVINIYMVVTLALMLSLSSIYKDKGSLK